MRDNAPDERLAQSVGQLVLRTMLKSPFKKEATVDIFVEDIYHTDGTTETRVIARARRWVPNEQPPWDDWPIGMVEKR